MQDTETIKYWSEIDGGFRSSVMLRLGAVATALGALANLGTQLLAGRGDASTPLTIVSWLLFILGLWLLAGGFIWVASNPFLTRFGFLVGTLYALQGVQLLIVLFTFTPATVPPISLTVGRLVATALFVWFERESLSRRTVKLLGAATGLELLKVFVRGMGYLPDLGQPLDPLLDAVLLLFLSAALLHLGTSIRHEEDRWARMIYESGHSDFDDFNNPEHDWNKTQPAGKKQKRN